MYDLRFKVPIDEKNFLNDKDNYLFFWEQKSICCRVIASNPHRILSTNISTLQAKAVTTTVNKIRNDLFSCLFLEVLNNS